MKDEPICKIKCNKSFMVVVLVKIILKLLDMDCASEKATCASPRSKIPGGFRLKIEVCSPCLCEQMILHTI